MDGTILRGPDCKGCIFGEALQNMGWSDPEQMKCSNEIKFLFEDYCEIHRDDTEALNFGRVQRAQDDGKTWGEAISLFGES